MFKVSNRNTRARCEICSKLTIKTPERHQWGHSSVFIVNLEHISHLVSIVSFEQVNAGSKVSPIGLALNPFMAKDPILYPLKIPENLWFASVLRGYKMRTLARNR